jgi:hypothetical protein
VIVGILFLVGELSSVDGLTRTNLVGLVFIDSLVVFLKKNQQKNQQIYLLSLSQRPI